MAINSRAFVCQLRNASVFCLNFTWAHPMISLLLCISVFVCIWFPRVFKLLIFSAPLIVSTALFLAAILSVGPQTKEPDSKRKDEKPSAECHEDGCGRAEIEIKQLAVVSRNEEAYIADFAEQTVVGERAEIDDNADETHKFGEKEAEIMESVKEEEDITMHGPEEEEEEEEEEKEVINAVKARHGSPQAFAVKESGEESFLVELPNSSSVSESDEEVGGKVSPQNIFALPLHSSWKRFDSSSDSGSEGSVGSLGPLFDGIDPVVFGEEDPNAGEERVSVDFRFSWDKDEGDENLFELAHRGGSDSLSEDENLIEIAVSEEQVVERQGLQMQEICVQEKNLVCLNNSDGEILEDRGCVQKENLISKKKAAFPEEENLIEIDLSADPFVVAAHEETNPAEIGSRKVENGTVLSKKNPIDSSQQKKPSDLLNEPICGDSSDLADQGPPSESQQKNEGKSVQEVESVTKEVAAENLTCKHAQNHDGSPEQSTRTVHLIDMGSSPVTQMQIAEEDKHLNPKNTEQPSDDSTTSCITGIEKCNTTNIEADR